MQTVQTQKDLTIAAVKKAMLEMEKIVMVRISVQKITCWRHNVSVNVVHEMPISLATRCGNVVLLFLHL